MKDAERQHDEQLVQKAEGGLMQQVPAVMPTVEPMPMMPTANQESQIGVQNQMIGANRMPSLMTNQ